MLDMPPGSSEGVHIHSIDDTSEGPLDEYYHVISGSGIMRIDGQVIDVTQGDLIYTPAGVLHGIENNAETGNLKIMLTVLEAAPHP